MTELLTEREVADLLRKTGKWAVRRLRQSGKLPYVPGRPILIPRRAVEDYIAAQLAKTASGRARPAPRLNFNPKR